MVNKETKMAKERAQICEPISCKEDDGGGDG